jgi:Tfp pilus assembly protein PilX
MNRFWEFQETPMGESKHRSRGFTLIAAVLLLALLSALAVGVMYLVTNEGHMSSNEQEDNLASYGAQSGIEKLTSDLAALYSTSMSPTNGQIQNLVNFPPTTAEVGNIAYNPPPTITYNTDINGNPVSTVANISSGNNAGLYASIIPMTLSVNATRPTGASVNITRKIEVALIPVFQFGVFCGYDCSYFPGPDFSFGGRVHTNGNLYLADGNMLVFNDKIAAFSQIVTDRLENGHATSNGYTGTVYVSTATGGCALNTFPPPTGGTTNCTTLPAPPTTPGDASWYGGIPPGPNNNPPGSGQANPSFSTISAGPLKGYVATALTGVSNMQLPFVQNSCTSNPPPCTDPIQIIRKAQANDVLGGALSQSRLYNKAQIRVLLADTQADLHPERGPIGDGQDVQFTPNGLVAVAGVGNQYFAMAQTGQHNWVSPFTDGGPTAWGTWPLLGEITTIPGAGTGAWIRVEYLNNAGNWVGVTTEWLGLGFGRAFNTPPTTPKAGAGQNAINPSAILILQQLQPNLGVGSATGAGSQYNWYPINFYDPREGEIRDVAQAAGSCAVNGIMNAVELDVGNLKLWLNGTIAGTGANVNFTNQNGYVLYFSDRRGMIVDPNQGNVTYGESGLEDVVNRGSVTGLPPDGVLEPPSNYQYSPEDVDLNGVLDNWGERNIGYGFGVNTNTAPLNSYVRIGNCATNAAPPTGVGLANMVTGARHTLKLVDGRLNTLGTSPLPVRPDNLQGGFTVASENPVYVQGDYNTSSLDPFWANNAINNTPHAAAAIIADSVTVLSNQWSDVNSLYNTTNPGARVANVDAYYRMAVAGGKNIPFPTPQPTWGGNDSGTDGGLHNFLRYVEKWNTNLWYQGSLVNMYYSEYDTGVFKCCTTVYSPPARKYYFDTLFLNPANLPPATPTFQDINNLSYRQNFQPQ